MKNHALAGRAIDRTHPALVIASAILVMLFSGLAALAGIGPNDMTSGSLLLKLKGGGYVEAPRQESDYTITVSGPTARTVLTQRFTNPSDGWVEGVYVFPLPENAAVDTLKIVAGNRVIVGEVKAREEAKTLYLEAKAAGQTAALVEQERPNIFTNSVANIGPREIVVVQIEYQEAIKQTAGTSTLRLPLVVAPRYNPAPVNQAVDVKADGTDIIKTNDPVPDRDRIAPPVLDPRKDALVNPVTISVALNAGFALGEVKSHHHAIKTVITGEASQYITLDASSVPANRDFELTWTARGTVPHVGLFKETIGGKTYVLATVTPPAAQPMGTARPRETVFVIDNSGSMDGPSMVQAKEALLVGLGKLKPDDRFNVIRFDDTMNLLFPTAVAADAGRINLAKQFVSALAASGGTEMIPPLKAALVDDRVSATSHLRQVVFITDGAIGNEQEMFSILTANRGRSRVFMVGIGSAPNSYLMTRAAELGRGSFTYIGDAYQVTARMDELFNKLGQPVATNLEARLTAGTAVLTPSQLPDLYVGEPLLVMAEATTLAGDLVLNGQLGDKPWTVTLPLSAASEGKGISKLWARRQINDIEVAATLGAISNDELVKSVREVALLHQIVSSQTSLIAVDRSPKRPPGVKLTRAEVPLNLPAGWNFEKVFGIDQPPEPVDERDAKAEFLQLAISNAPVTSEQALANQVELPQGSTPAMLMAMVAAVLLMLSVIMRIFARKMEA